MAAAIDRPWRFFRCFVLCLSGQLALAEGLLQQLAEGDAQEAFGRRSCKFRPLPSNLSEGYTTPEGGYEVAETFGVPLAVLVGAGHRLVADVADVALMGFTIQLPFHGSVQVLVEATVGQRTLKCTHTWGAGGHMKQCGLTRIQLPPGPVTLTFRATGLGVSSASSACLTLRLDLEISSHKASESARMCFQSALPAAAPPLLSVSGSGDASIPVTTFSSPAPNGVIWKAALPAAQANHFNRLFARVTFPSMVHPVRLLIEELKPWTSIGDEPKCLRRCFTGTQTAHGQVLQRLLPPAMPFALWILTDDHDGSGIAGGHCANYDFELRVGPVPMSSMAQDFLGPPAWLCEGGAWPRRLEQSTDGIAMTVEQVLRQRRFALRDLFDLTRPPESATSTLGGLHAIEIQVSEPCLFRLTTHAPSVPARPVLVPGRQDEAWLALSNPNNEILTRRIPAAGREFRHSISTELSAGEYTLLFVLEMPTGGLRPCASLFLNLLLEPLAAGPVPSTCMSDAGNGILDLQAMAEPLPVTAWRPSASSFMVTLPRPPGGFEEGAGDAQGLQIIARSSMNLGYSATDPSAPPVMLHAKVRSPFSTADLQVTFYENGQPLGEPMPLADGNGYRAMAGPVVKDGFYEVVLFHVPREPSTSTHCVEFDVELAAVSLTPPTALGQFIAPLPGAENCWTVDQLPTVIRVGEGESSVLEGNFQLPEGAHHIQFISSVSRALGHLLLRVSVSSRDAEVRVGQEPILWRGLAEDRFFHRGPEHRLTIRARSTGRADHLCPVLRMHLVVVPEPESEDCSRVAALGSLQALGSSLESALLEQSSDSAQLKRVAAQLRLDESQAATVPLKVLSVSAELRVELAIEAPWLPLELKLFRDGQEEKAWATAHFAGQRLVMLLPSLPKGQYQLKLGYWSWVKMPLPHCAALLGTVALLAAKGRDTSNYRQEMLDLPELLAVRAPPNPLLPGWFRAQRELLSSEIYTVPAGGSVSSQLQLQSPCIFRVVAEPTDILAPRLSLELKGGDATLLSTTATGSGLVQKLPAGTYELIFRSNDQALADAVPFFVTWGILASGVAPGVAMVPCDGLARMEDATVGVTSGGAARQGSSWEFKKQLNVAALPTALKLPLTVPQPAVATIASWSPFTQHYVRVALVSDEGLWVGEQRGRRSALEIELPPGDYQMMLEEMSPLVPPDSGCMAMGVAVSLVPFSAIERSSSAMGSVPPFLGSSLGLGARCDGLGALPLPLDAISATAGSAAYGGPVDADGRLLIRERIMLTDIHDGRKKVFLRLPAASMLRVAVVSEDAMETEVVLEDSSHQQIAPVESHIMGEGQAASYIMEAPAQGLWLSFHREHRVAQTSGCASFDLLLQSAPMQDMVKMSACGGIRELTEMVYRVLEHFHESTIGSSEGRLRIPGAKDRSYMAPLHLELAEESLVEVEVQFNFLLSNVHVWLDTKPFHERSLSPRVRAHGTAAAEKNAHATLRLRLDPGKHIIYIRHDPAFPAEAPIQLQLASPQCAPFALKLRRMAVKTQRPVISMPMAPLVSGADLVLHLSGGNGGNAVLAQRPPSAASQGSHGGHTLAWSSQALSGLLGVSGRQVSPAAEGVSQIWALPLRLENGGGEAEVWFALDRRKTGQPWTGDATPSARSAPATLWPVDEPLAATNSAVSLPAAAPTTLPPLAAAVGMLSIPDEPKHEKSAGGILSTSAMFCWLVVLCLLAYYLHIVQPVWFVHFMRKSQSMLAMVHGLHAEREHHFGQFEAAAEMTNPWSWPTTIPTRAAPRVPRSRMYGTLDP